MWVKWLAVFVSTLLIFPSAFAFEGRIQAVITRGGETTPLLYTVSTNFLRIEIAATNRPNAVDILDRNSGQMTLLFPNNRSYVRLKSSVTNPAPQVSALPQPGNTPPAAHPNAPSIPAPTTGLPSGIDPQLSSTPSATGIPAASGIRAFPMTPMEQAELKATGETTNILGFTCARYELKQRGETMEIWATDKLFPFQPYVQNQPHRFGPRMTEEQWSGLLTAKKVFPLRASLRFENGAERFRFEVKSVTTEKNRGLDGKLFEPPPGYQEIEPLPF